MYVAAVVAAAVAAESDPQLIELDLVLQLRNHSYEET